MKNDNTWAVIVGVFIFLFLFFGIMVPHHPKQSKAEIVMHLKSDAVSEDDLDSINRHGVDGWRLTTIHRNQDGSFDLKFKQQQK